MNCFKSKFLGEHIMALVFLAVTLIAMVDAFNYRPAAHKMPLMVGLFTIVSIILWYLNEGRRLSDTAFAEEKAFRLNIEKGQYRMFMWIFVSVILLILLGILAGLLLFMFLFLKVEVRGPWVTSAVFAVAFTAVIHFIFERSAGIVLYPGVAYNIFRHSLY